MLGVGSKCLSHLVGKWSATEIRLIFLIIIWSEEDRREIQPEKLCVSVNEVTLKDTGREIRICSIRDIQMLQIYFFFLLLNDHQFCNTCVLSVLKQLEINDIHDALHGWWLYIIQWKSVSKRVILMNGMGISKTFNSDVTDDFILWVLELNITSFIVFSNFWINLKFVDINGFRSVFKLTLFTYKHKSSEKIYKQTSTVFLIAIRLNPLICKFCISQLHSVLGATKSAAWSKAAATSCSQA